MYKNQPVICLQCKGEEAKYGYEAGNTHVEKDHNSEVRFFLVNSKMTILKHPGQARRARKRRVTIERHELEDCTSGLGSSKKLKRDDVIAESIRNEPGRALVELSSNIDPRLDEL
jgi:hypothetical protein